MGNQSFHWCRGSQPRRWAVCGASTETRYALIRKECQGEGPQSQCLEGRTTAKSNSQQVLPKTTPTLLQPALSALTLLGQGQLA